MKKNHLLIIVSLVFLDQLSKLLVVKYLYHSKPINLGPYISLIYSENTGIAFSLLNHWHQYAIIILNLIICFIIWLQLLKSRKKLNIFGYILIISGALSNIIDRIRTGYVIDFVYFHIGHILHFAIFNLADSFISVGAMCILYSSFIKNV